MRSCGSVKAYWVCWGFEGKGGATGDQKGRARTGELKLSKWWKLIWILLFCSDLVGPEVVTQQRPSWCLGCTQLPLRQLQCWKSAGREGDLKPLVQGVILSPFPECHRAGITEYAAFSDQITIFSVTDLEAFNKYVYLLTFCRWTRVWLLWKLTETCKAKVGKLFLERTRW